MEKTRARTTQIRKFIIENLPSDSAGLVSKVTQKFDCTRQAVNKHVRKLIDDGIVSEAGNTRNKTFCRAVLAEWEKSYSLTANIAEDQVWREDIAPALGKLPDNVIDIWHYGFTEMFNNAIDHSASSEIVVAFEKDALFTKIAVLDNGIGIFKKIQSALGLLDERHAVLELAKGKFSTDPSNHTGEGIFFSSRIFDSYSILSGEVFFSHDFNEIEDWVQQNDESLSGTLVTMKLRDNSTTLIKDVFDSFTDSEDYCFIKTVVPVELALYGDDNLVSRSQAKRLLHRIDKFKIVVFDFEGVTTIGQAFADEIFRVFARQHTYIEISAINTSPEVKRMIRRAQTHDN